MAPDSSFRKPDRLAERGETAEPVVLIVLVATNAAEWLRETIACIKAQTYGSVDVVAVDNASTDSSRQILDRAFGKGNVVRLERRVGYARALSAGLGAASERAAAADAFLILHDDCAMEPDVVEKLVDALGYEDVGIAGPKLVEWDAPDVLQEAGLSIDRYGRSFDPLEQGELDQGQHDRVRETMWLSSACMLVSRETIQRVGFFDLRFVAFREDLDLCWRARVAGFKTAFCGVARARHAAATTRELRPGFAQGRIRYFVERNLLASLIKSTSLARLAVVLPIAITLSVSTAILDLLTGRRRDAAQILEALRWNLAHLPSTIRAHARTQRIRKVADSEVMRLAARGAHRVRTIAERAFERVAGDPAEGVEEAEGFATPGQRVKLRIRDRVKAHPVGAAATLITLLYLIGSRTLFRGGPIAGADMPPFPDGPTEFFRAFFSGWREAGTGGAGAAPPAGFMSGLMSILTLGSPWLAQRILLLGLVPLAGLSAARLAARMGAGVGARRVAAAAYALSPLTLWALAEGRLSDLVLVAAAPALLVPLMRAAGFAPPGGWRDVVVATLGCAVAIAFSPWTVVFVFGAGLALGAGAAAAGHGDRALRTVATSLVLAAGALVVLLPWSIELFRDGSALGIGGALPVSPAEDLLRLSPSGAGPIPVWLATALPLAAAAGFLLAPPERERAARGLLVAGLAGFAAAWAVTRGVPWIAPRASLPLALYGAATAGLIAIGAEGVRPTLRGRQFGFTQIGSFAVTIVLAVAIAAGGLWVVRGDRPGLQRADELAPAFLAADREAFGDYRVLWVSGDAGRLAAALSPATGETMATYAERRAGAGQEALDRVLAGVAAGTIDAGGRQLAPFGVRYVFVRQGSPELADAFGRQSDLRFVQRFEGSSVFANDAWLPVGVSVSAQGWAVASQTKADGTVAAIAGSEPNPQRGEGFARVRNDHYAGTVREGGKRVLLGVAYDEGWKLVLPDAGKTAPAARSFGWATGFPAAGTGSAAIVWRGQVRYRLMLIGQLVLLGVLAMAWSRRVATERGER